MNNLGWISLNRKIMDSWLWQSKPFSIGQAWIDMLLLTNHSSNKFPIGNEVITLKPGDFITSESKLMERWGWSKSKLRRFLKLLENDQMIIKKVDHKKTTITIVNYVKYQNIETDKKPIKNHSQTNIRPKKDTNNNVNNDNNVNNNINSASEDTQKPSKADIEEFFELIWSRYPNKKGKGQVSFSKKKVLYSIGFDEMTRAVNRYIKDLAPDSDWRKPQNGSTFFNSGYVDYLDANYNKGVEDCFDIEKEKKRIEQEQLQEQRQRDYEENQKYLHSLVGNYVPSPDDPFQ